MSDENNIEIGSDNELLALIGARLGEDGVPSRVLLVPWGQVQSSSGDFVVDEESARLVTQAFQEHGLDLPIDYEHQTLGGAYTSPSGQAPAAGWIKRLVAEEGVGIFAEVTWTPPAVEQLAARQYRFLSPVALVRKSDRKLVALHSAALTNKPAIAHMTPIVNRNALEDEAALQSVVAGLRECMGLAADCADVEVLASARERLASATRDSAHRDAEERVAELQRQGRLTGVQRDWALRLALSDAALFEDWAKTAPIVVPLGRAAPPSRVDCAEAGRERMAAGARAEFRGCAALAQITSEEAYIAASLREPLLKSSGTH